MVDPKIDCHLGNSDHSSISFYVKMALKIPNISFPCTVYLKSRDLLNQNWTVVYNSHNPVSELNMVITFLIDKRVPSKVVRRKVNEYDGCFCFLSWSYCCW